MEHLGPRQAVVRLVPPGQEPGVPGLGLLEAPRHEPEPAQRARQGDSHREHAVSAHAPGQGSAHVVVIALELRVPGASLGGPQQHRLGPLSQVAEELRMAAARFPCLSARVELLDRELANRLQHAVTRSGLIQRLDEHEALADQPADRLERANVIRASFDESFHRLERESAHEYTELAEQALLGRRQQVIAPGDRRPQRLLPFGQVPGAARKQGQAALQPRQQADGREYRQAGGRELQRQRQPVQAAADLGHRRRVGFGQLKVGPGVTRAGDEEGDRRNGRERAQVNGGARLRQRERRDGHHSLIPDTQRLTTGRQHLQPRAPAPGSARAAARPRPAARRC